MPEPDITSTSPPPSKAEDLRVEYAALASYFNTLIGFRIALLGFYVAGIALLIGDKWTVPIPRSVLGLLITAAVYLFELRTRVLYEHLAKRGMQVEAEWYGVGDGNEGVTSPKSPFFTRQFPRLSRVPGDYYGTNQKILGFIDFKWKWLSHSISLDMLYISIFLFLFVALVTRIALG